MIEAMQITLSSAIAKRIDETTSTASRNARERDGTAMPEVETADMRGIIESRRLRAALQHARSRQEGELGKQLAQVVRAWNAGTSYLPSASPTELEGEGDVAVAGERVLTLHNGSADGGRDPASYIARFTVREDGRIRVGTGQCQTEHRALRRHDRDRERARIGRHGDGYAAGGGAPGRPRKRVSAIPTNGDNK